MPVEVSLWRLWAKILWSEFLGGLTNTAGAGHGPGNGIGNSDWLIERGWTRWFGRQLRYALTHVPWVGPTIQREIDRFGSGTVLPEADTGDSASSGSMPSWWPNVSFHKHKVNFHKDDVMIFGLFVVLIATMLVRREMWRRHRLRVAAEIRAAAVNS